MRVSRYREASEVRLPIGFLILAEFKQKRPSVEPGIMTVIKHQLNAIVPHRLDISDPNIFFANL